MKRFSIQFAHQLFVNSPDAKQTQKTPNYILGIKKAEDNPVYEAPPMRGSNEGSIIRIPYFIRSYFCDSNPLTFRSHGSNFTVIPRLPFKNQKDKVY